MDKRHRLAVMLDADTLAAIDAEVRRRRMADGGRHSRASVIRSSIPDPEPGLDDELVGKLEHEIVAWRFTETKSRDIARAALLVVREHDRNRT